MSKSKLQVIRFRVGNEVFTIPIEYASEIVKVTEIDDYPTSNEYVAGITNVRDDVITLIDTQKILYEEDSSSYGNHILLLNTTNLSTKKNVGFLVDYVDQVEKFNDENIDFSAMDNDESVKGIVKDNDADELIPLLNVNNLIDKV